MAYIGSVIMLLELLASLDKQPATFFLSYLKNDNTTTSSHISPIFASFSSIRKPLASAVPNLANT